MKGINLSVFVCFVLLLISCDIDDEANRNATLDTQEPEQPVDMTPETPQNVTYDVTFVGEWTAQSHPNSFPADDHFSSTILFMHNDQSKLYEENQLASAGIEDMSEIGNNDALVNEMQAIINANNGLEFVVGNCCIAGNGTDSLTINASQDFALLSYVAMIAPSPDWFTGISSAPLFIDGAWVESIEIDVIAYDAGTEEGNTFSYNNPETSPRQPIQKITEAPLGDGTSVSPRLGKLVITLQQ